MDRKHNPDLIRTHRITFNTAGEAQQLPPVLIPEGFHVRFVTPFANAGYIYIAPSKSEAESISDSFGMYLNTSLELKIRNLNAIWVCAGSANDALMWITVYDSDEKPEVAND